MRIFGRLAATSLLGALLVGCGGYSATGGPAPLVERKLTTQVDPTFQPGKVNELLVMPLVAGIGMNVGPEVLASADELLKTELSRGTSVSFAETSAEVRSQFTEAPQWVPLRQRAADIGRAAGAQAVLYGQITRYEESEGSRLGSEHPGAAGFSLWLLDPSTQRVLWTATYQDSDRPLSENLFRLGGFLNSGGGYKGSTGLMRAGFRDAAAALEKLRADRPAQ